MFSGGSLFVESFDNKETLKCQLKGSLKEIEKYPIAGDIVSYVKDQDTFLVIDVDERKNELKRPKVANIDYLIIVQSYVSPDINLQQLYKYIMFYNSFNIYKIIIAITKTDLVKGNNFFEKYQCLKDDSFFVYDVNNEKEYKELIKKITGKISVFTGQSGVGKSTLLNKIDSNFLIKTATISKALNRGKHTTTSTFLYNYKGGFLIDTPGFSSINLNLSKDEISKCFEIFNNASISCKFNNCLHSIEPYCKIKELLNNGKISKEMYSSYLENLKKIL